MSRKKPIRKDLGTRILFVILAALLSGLLILSMPIVSSIVKGDLFKTKERKNTELVLKKIDLQKPKPKPKKERRKPKRSKPNHRNVKSGPRFAMNLDVAGAGGANVSLDLINKSRGDGGGQSGDVDSKPRPLAQCEMRVPEAIIEFEVNASVTVSFCIDVSGGAYDVRILNEEPVGMGLGNNSIRAIQNCAFEPALRDNEAVPFCGMEKEFEFRFSE
ncbi:MAG: energy transducer TonB [Fibrobacterales bacterium]